VLTLWAPQTESLWEESLPLEVKELPADLAELDRVLRDPELMMVLLERWRQEVLDTGRAGTDRFQIRARDRQAERLACLLVCRRAGHDEAAPASRIPRPEAAA